MKIGVNRMRLEHIAKAFGKTGKLFVRPDWQDFSTLYEKEITPSNGGRPYVSLRPMPPWEQVIEVDTVNFDTGELTGWWAEGPDRGGRVLTSVNFVWPLTPRGDIWVTGESHPYGDRQLREGV